MDLAFTPEEQRFREEVREWLFRKTPKEVCPPVGPEHRAFMLEWQRTQFEDGWAGVAWPRQYGGRGLSLIEQLIWHEEYALAGAPWTGCLFVGLNHAGPTLIVHGDEAQKTFHLPRILKGETVWCQGFSEPNAGSDLANVQTRGVVDGDHLVVTGQKIWTSYAHIADYQELVVRTEATDPKHRGLTWVINDMTLPGISIRPIRSMSGQDHFCEVFYDEVRIPLGNVVGKIGGGWPVTLATLSFERGTAFMAHQIELSMKVEKLIELAGLTRLRTGRPAIEDGSIAADLAQARAEVIALRAMTYLSVSRARRQETPGPEGSIVALCFGELSQKVQALAMRIRGPEGLERNGSHDDWSSEYLETFRNTIAGGTSEIRRNIIGERVLGLPR